MIKAIKARRADIGRLEASLLAANLTKQTLEADVHEQANIIVSLQGQLAASQAEVHQSSADLSNLTETLSTAQLSKQALTTEVAEQANTIKSLEHLLAASQAQQVHLIQR